MNTITNTRILSKVLRNHLNNDELTSILRKPIGVKHNSEDEKEVEGELSSIRKLSEVRNENDENDENEIPNLKDIDSGNVSPESIPINSFREDSRLSNTTPINVYTPNTFLRELQNQQESEEFE